MKKIGTKYEVKNLKTDVIRAKKYNDYELKPANQIETLNVEPLDIEKEEKQQKTKKIGKRILKGLSDYIKTSEKYKEKERIVGKRRKKEINYEKME
jgi:hypothetical protein